jgi:hypothetical protein
VATEYQVISGTKKQVEAGVTAALADGWELSGTLAMAALQNAVRYGQGMIRTRDDPPQSIDAAGGASAKPRDGTKGRNSETLRRRVTGRRE